MNILKPGSQQFGIAFRPADDVTDPKTEVIPHLRSMYAVLNRNKGISLGAQQVGIRRKFFIYGGAACGMGHIRTVINPTIVRRSKAESVKPETDLTDRENPVHAVRPDWVEVSFQDTLGETHLETFHGLLAQVFFREVERQGGGFAKFS